MIKGKTLFCILLAGTVLLNLFSAEMIFEWGHDGLNAKIAGENRKPKSAVNVRLEEGGIRLSRHSQVRFDVSKLPALPEYTLVFRGKIKFDVRGNNTYHDRDRLDDGKTSFIIGGGRRSLISSGPLRNHFCSSSWNEVVYFNRWFFKDEWHWFAIGKDLKRGQMVYQLDNRVQYFHTKKGPAVSLGKELCFGSPQPGSRDPRAFGVDMVIGDLALYDKMLSKQELLALFGKMRTVEAELGNYAVISGKKETLRFKFRNYSDRQWDKPVTVTITDGQGNKVTEDKISLKLAAGKDVHKTLAFNAPKPGLYRIKFDTGRSFEILALNGKPYTAKMKPGELKLKLVEEIDCTKPLPGRFISDGKDKIVKDKSGIYREGSTVYRSSFAYKLKELADPNRYHVLEIEYPDNARRTYSVQVWAEFFDRIQSGQMNALGIITGGQHPVSDTMRKRQLLWLPYSRKTYVVLDNYASSTCERGPAASKLRVYEVRNEKLPLLKTGNGGRQAGVWDEDCVMDIDWINMPYQFERIDLTFWREKVERIAEYARYMGYNTWTYQIADYFGNRNTSHMDVVSGRSTHITGWDDVYAKVFEREKIPFRQRLAMGHIIPSRSGPVRLFENPSDYPTSLEDHFARGTECPAGIARNGSITNVTPLHPKVEKEYLKHVIHCRDRYSGNPYFKGLTIHDTIIPGSLEQGYGNWEIAQFEKAAGVKVPYDPVPKRCIEKRYQFLTSPKLRKKWIRWRCREYARFLRNLTEELRKGNNNLELQVWIAANASFAKSESRELRIRESLLESGVDMELLNKIEGLRVMPIIRPDFEHVRSLLKQQEMYALYDHSFADAFAGQKHPGLLYMLHNNQENFNVDQFPLKKFFVPVGNWNWVKNKCYAYSWANCWPVDEFAMLPLANTLANMDLDHITIGFWGFPDSGVHHLIRPFWQAFRSIPKGRYALKSDPDAPAALRVCGNNFYLVNKENFPVEISLDHSGLKDLVTCKPFKAKNFTLGPCEVRVFSGKFKSFKQSVKPDAPSILKKQIADLETTARIIGDPKIGKLLAETKQYYRQGKYTKARQMFHLHEIAKVLAENKGLKLTAKLEPKEAAAEVSVTSFDPETRKVSVWIDKADGCWNADPNNKTEFTLKPGESRTFRIKLKDALVKDGWNGTVTLAMSSDNGAPVRKTFLLGGNFARHSDITEIGKDWTFSKYRMKNFSSFNPKTKQQFSWSQGYAWNEKGLFIATIVEDKDYLPADFGHMHFQSDSMQYFIDGKNVSVYDAAAYDDSIMELITAEVDGKFKVFHCYVPKRGVPREKSGIRTAYHRENGKSYWELFIPAKELPDVQFRKGYVLGACAMINNRMKNKSGNESFMTNQEIFPYMKPGTWKDLILTDENGKL